MRTAFLILALALALASTPSTTNAGVVLRDVEEAGSSLSAHAHTDGDEDGVSGQAPATDTEVATHPVFECLLEVPFVGNAVAARHLIRRNIRRLKQDLTRSLGATAAFSMIAMLQWVMLSFADIANNPFPGILSSMLAFLVGTKFCEVIIEGAHSSLQVENARQDTMEDDMTKNLTGDTIAKNLMLTIRAGGTIEDAYSALQVEYARQDTTATKDLILISLAGGVIGGWIALAMKASLYWTTAFSSTECFALFTAAAFLLAKNSVNTGTSSLRVRLRMLQGGTVSPAPCPVATPVEGIENFFTCIDLPNDTKLPERKKTE